MALRESGRLSIGEIWMFAYQDERRQASASSRRRRRCLHPPAARDLGAQVPDYHGCLRLRAGQLRSPDDTQGRGLLGHLISVYQGVKFEIRNPKQAQGPKLKIETGRACIAFRVLMLSVLEFVSDFGFRISSCRASCFVLRVLTDGKTENTAVVRLSALSFRSGDAGQLLHRGLEEIGVGVHAAHFESQQEKEWYYRWFRPDVVVGVGYLGPCAAPGAAPAALRRAARAVARGRRIHGRATRRCWTVCR